MQVYLQVRPLARHAISLLVVSPSVLFLLGVVRRPSLLLDLVRFSCVWKAVRTGSSVASSLGWGLAILEVGSGLVGGLFCGWLDGWLVGL
jgi:uncharacterized membrane protein